MSYALITGSSKGIGKAIAEELARRNMNLILAARSAELLHSVAADLQARHKVKCLKLPIDLADAGAAKTVEEFVSAEKISVSMLINNAGYAVWGEFEKASWDELQNMLQLNMLFMTELTHRLIPHLKKHPKSYIMNVASTAAYQAVSTLALYAASKSFVVQFTRALRRELKGSNISVSCLSPGTTDSHFMDRARMEALKHKAQKFAMKPEEVARIAVKEMLRGKAEIIPGFLNWFSVGLVRHLPKNLVEKIAADIYRV